VATAELIKAARLLTLAPETEEAWSLVLVCR